MVEIIGIALSTILSIIAIVISIIAKKEANKLAAENTRLSNGNLEIQLRGMISGANKLLCSVLQYCGTLEDGADKKKEYADVLMNISQQEILNAYEEACMKYLDEKIDKARFKKTYIKEIRQLVESESNKDKFGTSSSYTAIKKVYDEWNNLER